nr:uncharacterized protein LOC123751215 [Procambarus clarkii]
MKKLLLVSLTVAWVAALLCVPGVLAEVNGNANSTDLDSRDKTADPFDCTRYYICISSNETSTDSFPCPTGTSFNSSTHDCSGSLPCSSNGPLPPCPTTCRSDPGAFPDTKKCNLYYVCSGGSTLGPFECPADKPYFDSAAQTCSVSLSMCCLLPVRGGADLRPLRLSQILLLPR